MLKLVQDLDKVSTLERTGVHKAPRGTWVERSQPPTLWTLHRHRLNRPTLRWGARQDDR
jgi:hypothetical protein